MRLKWILVLAGLVAMSAWGQTTDPSIMQKVYLAKQIFPSVKTVGVLCNTSGSMDLLKGLKLACDTYQLELKVYNARDLLELRSSFEKMVRASKIDIVWMIPDDVVNQAFGRRFLAEKCMAMKIPLYVHSVDYLREGGLLTISMDVNNSSKAFVNRKVQEMMGITFPAELQSKIVDVEY
jgi:ABC-type uncharacterized transport system substrate-binding protein